MEKSTISKEVLLKLEGYLNLLKSKWDALYPNKDSSYISFGKSRVLDCTVFIISVLDNLILFVQDNIPKGSDKKIAVMSIVSKVFDYTVVNSAPIWLKPFIPTIKEIIVNIVISQLVEFIVKKYKEGLWSKDSAGGNFPDAPQSALIYTSRKDLNG